MQDGDVPLRARNPKRRYPMRTIAITCLKMMSESLRSEPTGAMVQVGSLVHRHPSVPVPPRREQWPTMPLASPLAFHTTSIPQHHGSELRCCASSYLARDSFQKQCPYAKNSLLKMASGNTSLLATSSATSATSLLHLTPTSPLPKTQIRVHHAIPGCSSMGTHSFPSSLPRPHPSRIL